MHLNGKKLEMSINGKKLARNQQMDRLFMFMKIFWAQRVALPLPQGYVHVYDHNIQASSSLKPLKIFFSRTRRPMILKLGMKHQAMQLYKVCISHDPGMTLTFFTARPHI